MADMDTYDDQRGYEGNYYTTAHDSFAATTAMPEHDRDYYGRHDREREYPRERSRSPGPDRDGDSRIRDGPMNGRSNRDGPPKNGGEEDESVNPGSNLFVTGIHPSLKEEDVEELFSKHGAVEKCNIMRDPHTRDSRGFGFVKMVTGEEADAAKDALQGEVIEGRTLSIEKARRAKPRTPTPGKYFGPPKRDDRPPMRRPYGGDRYDDRGGYGRRDDSYRRGGGGGYRDRYDDRGSGRRDEPRGGDRYARDRYDDRRGGGYGGSYGGYDRAPRGPPGDAVGGGYGGSRDAPPPRDYERRSYD